MVHRLTALLSDTAALLRLSLRLQLGRWAWLVPALALLWPAYHVLTRVAGWRQFDAINAQNGLIGIPLTVLAIGLGVRVVASEIEQGTLEVAYTVPGGARRVWIGKLGAIGALLFAAGGLLAIFAAVFLTRFPLSAFYGALQGAAFYLVLSAGLGALVRSEIPAALVASVLLGLNGFLTAFGNAPSRWSPFFNPLAVKDLSETEVFAWTVQNRIGVALAIVAIVTLTCVRAERREALLNRS